MRTVVEPRVERHELLAADALKPPYELREQAERRREQVALERVRLGAGRRDHDLVGDAARDRAAGGHPVALDDLDHGRQSALGDDERRGRGQPGELRVRVGKRRSGLVALVDQWEAVTAHLARPSLPRLGDQVDRRIVQLSERVHVGGAVDHDLLPLERRVEVRHHSHPPSGRAVAEP